MDMRIENVPGFGIPTNVRKSDPIHWYTTKDRRACSAEDEGAPQLFSGPRFGIEIPGMVADREANKRILEERGVCLKCLLEVLKAAEVLGTPTGFPLDLKVKIR